MEHCFDKLAFKKNCRRYVLKPQKFLFVFFFTISRMRPFIKLLPLQFSGDILCCVSSNIMETAP